MNLQTTYLNEFNNEAERVKHFAKYGDQQRAHHALQVCRINLIAFFVVGGSMFTTDDDDNVQPTRELKLFAYCQDLVENLKNLR